MEMWDVLRLDLPELRQTGKVVKLVDGKPTTFTSELELVSQTFPKFDDKVKQLRESGIYFLMPRKLQTAINDIWSNLPFPMSATDAQIGKLAELMTKLRDYLTKELGID